MGYFIAKPFKLKILLDFFNFLINGDNLSVKYFYIYMGGFFEANILKGIRRNSSFARHKNSSML